MGRVRLAGVPKGQMKEGERDRSHCQGIIGCEDLSFHNHLCMLYLSQDPRQAQIPNLSVLHFSKPKKYTITVFHLKPQRNWKTPAAPAYMRPFFQ